MFGRRKDVEHTALLDHVAEMLEHTSEHKRVPVRDGAGSTEVPLPFRTVLMDAWYATMPLWKQIERSGSLALHVGGDFPGLELELWAIRQ